MVRILWKGGKLATVAIASATARASNANPSNTALNMAARVVVDLMPINAPAALASMWGVWLRVRWGRNTGIASATCVASSTSSEISALPPNSRRNHSTAAPAVWSPPVR